MPSKESVRPSCGRAQAITEPVVTLLRHETPSLPGVLATGLLPEIGSGVVGGALTGAMGGFAQNLLTAGANPDESLRNRLAWGLGGGAIGGAIGSKIGSWFGRDVTLASPDVQQAGQLLKNAGVDVNLQNLPLAGASAEATGALASPAQAQQINRAVGNVIGEPVTNFNPATLGDPGVAGGAASTGLFNKIGAQISNAANRGQVNLNVMPPGASKTIDEQLIDILNDAKASDVDPLTGNKIERVITQIRNSADPATGVISGNKFDTLVGAGSRLRGLTNAADDDLSGLAQRLDNTMDRGFQASSPAGVYNDWVDARTRYKLLNAVQASVKRGGGGSYNVDPGSFYDTLASNRYFPDLPSRTAATGRVGQMGELASALRTAFSGGTSGAAPAASPGLIRGALPYVGLGAAAGAPEGSRR